MVALPRDPSELPPPIGDGRLLHVCKSHSYEKLFYWSRALQEFARLTKIQWAGARVCIDLFASCGIDLDAETGQLGWGSALLALHAIDPFDAYILGEKDPERATVLADRIEDLALAEVTRLDLTDPHCMAVAGAFKAALTARPKAIVITGDANAAVPLVKLMMPGLPGRRIALSILDPYGVKFDWQSLAGLALHERMDLFILFPEDMDIERNLQYEERLDRFMPLGSEWRSAVAQVRNRGRAMRELYEEGIRRDLGLRVGDAKAIRANGRDIYKLLYASRHKRGLEVWDHARRELPGGQIEMHVV